MPDIASTNFSETDASNNAASPNGAPEGMAPSGVNDVIRATMGAVKRWHDQVSAVITSGGAANVQTLTHTVSKAAYVAGDVFTFIVGFTNSGSTTLNVDGLGAKTIKANAANLVGNELKAGEIVIVAYDGTNLNLVATSAPRGVAQGGTGQSQGVPSILCFGPAAGSQIGPGATTVYFGPIGANSTEGTVSFPVPFACSVRNMYTSSSAFAGAGQSFTYTLRKNQTSQAVTVIVTGGAASTGNDTTHSVSFAAGDLIDVQLVTTATAGAGAHCICVEIDKTP